MYYKLNDKVYGNKIEALIAAKEKTGDANNIEFIPHPDWDSYRWLDEPEESWKEILRQRALELREKYSYLRLWYTGGSDSQTILNTFIKNNIHLDEIIIGRENPVDKFDLIDNAELNWVAIPFLKAHKKELAKTKINIYNAGSKECHSLWSNEKYFVENNNESGFMVPSGMVADGLIPNLITPQKNAANITGMEKPIIGLDKNGFYMYYIDTLIFWQSKENPDYANDALENFYVAPKIWSKQCHMVKEFCKDKKGEYLKTLVNGGRISIIATDSICRDPLYIPFSLGKSPDLSTARVGKGVNVKLSKLTRYYKNSLNIRTFKDVFRENLAMNHGSQGLKLLELNEYSWFRIEETIKNKLGKEWFNNKNNIKDGIVGKFSKKYYLEHSTWWYNEGVSNSKDELEFRNAISEFDESTKNPPTSAELLWTGSPVPVSEAAKRARPSR